MSAITCDAMSNNPTDRLSRAFFFQQVIQVLGLPDPRKAERQSCSLPILYQTVTVQVPACGLGQIVDVSRDGAGVQTRRPVDPGEFVVIRPNSTCTDWQPVLLRVTHMRLLPSGEYHWGGAWLQPISPSQLEAMLAAADTVT
jgi:hypothetical protein